MRRFTKEAVEAGRQLWEELDEDRSDSDFVKSATVAIQEGPVWTGPRIPAGKLIKIATESVDMPEYPGDEAPLWEKRAYEVEVAQAMDKLAGFWGDAFKNLGQTFRGVLRGAPATEPIGTVEFLKKVVTKNKAGIRHLDPKALEKTLAGLQKADPLAGAYSKAQAGLAIAIPAMAVAAGANAWSRGQRTRQHGRVERALVNDPEFENQADKEQAISESYGLMRKYAPSIALDPVVSKSFVKLLVSMPDMQNIEVIQNLMEAEKKFQDSREFSTDFRDIQKLIKHPLVTPFAGGSGKKS